MNLRLWAIVILLATGCGHSPDRRPLQSSSPGPAASPGSASVPGATEPSPEANPEVLAGIPGGVPSPDGDVPRYPPSGSAKDDFPHLKRDLAWLAGMQGCVPSRRRDERIELSLDAYDNRLVLCAQVMTRRDVSVFFDMVSYACWNVDPATAVVTRRADLGRSYFRCQDGSCEPPEDNKASSYDGKHHVVFSDAKQELSIYTRPGGALVRSFPVKGQVFFRDGLTLVGRTLFVMEDGWIQVLDDRGIPLGKLQGIGLQVVDDGHVLAVRDDQHAELYDVATRKATPIKLAAPYVTGAVRHAGATYAVDGDARKLVMLDGKTLQPGRSLPLPVCP